jgi:excisionase family DNA binding protein
MSISILLCYIASMEVGMSGYMQREVVDKYDAADYLGLSDRTIVRMAQEGIIGRRLGKMWRFTMSELRDYASGRIPADAAKRGASNEQVEVRNS